MHKSHLVISMDLSLYYSDMFLKNFVFSNYKSCANY